LNRSHGFAADSSVFKQALNITCHVQYKTEKKIIILILFVLKTIQNQKDSR